MQSAVDKERNFEQTAQEIVSRMQTNPSSITSEVCSLALHSSIHMLTSNRTPLTSNLAKPAPSGKASHRRTPSLPTPIASPQPTKVT